METGEIQQPPQTIRFPQHVQEHWMAGNPFMRAITKAFLQPDAENAVFEESKITPEELRTLDGIKTKEQQFQKKYKESNDPSYYIKEYSALKTKNGEKPTEETLNNSLSLTLAAYKTAFPELNIWDTQRLALLRMTNALTQDDTSGLAVNLATGMGKSSVLIPCIIPTALLTTEHIDVLNLTPLSRNTNAGRFSKIGDLLGIKSAEMTATSSLKHIRTAKGKPYTLISSGTVTDAQKDALKSPVTFAVRTDIGHHMLRQAETNGDTSWLLQRKSLGIMDEIDHIQLEDQTSALVMAGEEENIDIILSRYAGLPEQINLDVINRLKSGLIKEMEETKKHCIGNPKEETVLTLTLFREYQRAASDIPAIDPDDHKTLYKKDKTITEAGEYDIFRRIWTKSQNELYDSEKLLPNDVYSVFRNVYPAHLTQALQSAINLSKDQHYFINDNVLSIKSERTGWPEKGKEFTPLVEIGLYAKESLVNAELKFPESLHESVNMIPPATLDTLLYTKILGLTGTAVPATEMFRKTRGIDVTMIPPQFESKITQQPYRTCTSLDDKQNVAVSFIQKHETDTVPFLINVPNTDIQNTLFARLQKEFPEKSLQLLSAGNAEEAQEVFSSAGKENTISIVVLMAGREVDIPVDDSVDSQGGLHILSWEPAIDRRNEIQLIGRTGRAGKVGDYMCLVSADDRIFSGLDSTQKQKISDFLAKKGNQQVTSIIRERQNTSDDKLQFEIEQRGKIYEPLTDIFREYLTLPAEIRTKINNGWGDFLTMVETKGLLHQVDYDFRSKGPAIQVGNWRNEVQKLYTTLQEVAATTPVESIRDEFIKRANTAV